MLMSYWDNLFYYQRKQELLNQVILAEQLNTVIKGNSSAMI